LDFLFLDATQSVIDLANKFIHCNVFDEIWPFTVKEISVNNPNNFARASASDRLDRASHALNGYTSRPRPQWLVKKYQQKIGAQVLFGPQLLSVCFSLVMDLRLTASETR
jgi:hypothetical protein